MNHNKLYNYLLLLLFLNCFNANAQQQNKTLYTAGHAGAFVGGLYDAYYPYTQLKQHGNFGLGAPDRLDGELIMLDGNIYQTHYTGKTVKVNDKGITPFAVVNFFHAEHAFKVMHSMSKEKLFAYLDSILPNQNAIYAIHIKGQFDKVKTRAFPPVTQKPYVPLADMLSLQHFFTFDNTKGDLVGYRIPAYMDGPNISGYHFHFLTGDKKGGGHMVNVEARDIIIEIERLNSFTVDLPQTKDFDRFNFKNGSKEDIKRVENGQKN